MVEFTKEAGKMVSKMEEEFFVIEKEL